MISENLTKAQLEKREQYLKALKKQKSQLVKRYGKDAESVMYGRATNMAKNETEKMNNQNLKELVRKSLMKESDIEVRADKIGGEQQLSQASALLDELEDLLQEIDWYYMMSDDDRIYDQGETIKQQVLGLMKKLKNLGYYQDAKDLYNQYAPSNMALKETSKFSKQYDDNPALKGGQKKLPDALQKSIIKKSQVDEDIDLGHQDNEPHHIKSELYKIGKYAMELYQTMDELEGKGEIDLPAWWQSKITKACSMISSAKHYLEFEMKEPQIDAMVDSLTNENTSTSSKINSSKLAETILNKLKK